MTEIRQYVLSLIAISLLCGITQLFFSGSSISPVVKLITGLMVTIAAVSPILRDMDISFDSYFENITFEQDWAVKKGEEAAANVAAEFIKNRAETYICDKAAAMGATVTAEVILSDDMPPVPAEVKVKGDVSAYVKKQLISCLQKDLGINEDKQTWIL